MATFKSVVRTDYKKADGTYRVYIRITHARRHKDRPTPFYVNQSQITKSGKLKDQLVIDKVDEKIREMREIVNHLGFIVEDVDVNGLIELIERKNNTVDFFDFWDEQVRIIKKDSKGTAELYATIKNSLVKYNNNKPLYLDRIDKKFVEGYYESIRSLSNNTKVSYIGLFASMYKRAQKRYNNQEAGIIVAKYGVFDTIELPRKEYKKDNAIKTIEEMQRIIDVPYSNKWWYDFSKDMFILSFVCFGTNMADWFVMTKENYRDGILYYRRKKTAKSSGDAVDIQIKVPEVGRIILDKYSGHKTLLIDTKTHPRRTDYVGRYIHYTFQKAGLEDATDPNSIGMYKTEYTFYSNRHTMASFARNICKVEYMTVHDMLNHAVPSKFKTTDAYLLKDYSSIWEANDKLIALFNWDFYLNQKKEDVQQ